MNPRLTIPVVILLIAALFYWFHIRPTNIKRKCLENMREKAVLLYNWERYPDTAERDRLQNQFINDNYRNCLIDEGL